KVHPVFAGEPTPIELRAVHDAQTLAKIRAGMDEFAVLIFRDQPFADAEQLAFAQRLDGRLHEGTGSRVIAKNRFGNEALSDISNLDADGEIMKADDRRRQYTLGNRLVRRTPRSLARSHYLASHQTRMLDWPLPEARLLLRDLTEHATQRENVYRHEWRVGDLVIWDNRATMHPARPFDDGKYRRELRRVTTLDIEQPALAAVGS